jgi:hypothetical protein
MIIEVNDLIDESGINLRKSKKKRRKRKEVGNVFGVNMEKMLEREKNINEEECEGVNLILKKVMINMERYGISEEGIMSIEGIEKKVEEM